MSHDKMLPCPLCGNKAKVTRLSHINGKSIFNVSRGVKDDDSDSCGLVLYGDTETKAEMIAKWNRRNLQDIVAVATVNGTCKAFRTADAFRKWQLENRDTPGRVMAWVDGIAIED